MRAYLIDPKLETITEVNIENYYGDEGWLVEALIGCDNSVPAAFIDGSNLLDGLDLVLISEDVLELEEDGDYSFQIDADRGLMMATRPIAGRAIVAGITEDGEFGPVAISLENLTRRVTFSRWVAEEIPSGILAAFRFRGRS